MKKRESDVRKRIKELKRATIKELKRITKEARDARLRAVRAYENGQKFLDSLSVKEREFLFESGLGQELSTAIRIVGEAATWSKRTKKQ